jgi:surfeit locus 1 family protein
LKKHIFNLFSFTVVILLFSLGTWQLQRLTWKQELIANVKNSIEQQAINFQIGKVREFQKVKLAGALLKDNYFVYRLNEKGEYGFNLISVLKIDPEYFILIQRGWIPKIEEKYKKNTNKDHISLEGIAYALKAKAPFTPENNKNENFFYHIDEKKIRKLLQIKISPFLIIQSSTDQFFDNLKNKQNTSMSNNHLQYAITWFVLGICIIIAFWFLKKRYK